MMDCKALNEADGDMDAAIEFLEEQAKAVKAGRIATEGIVMADVKEDKAATIVEVNSETDYVYDAEFRDSLKLLLIRQMFWIADMEGFMATGNWNEDASKTIQDALNEKSL